MNKLIIILISFLFASPAFARCTWTTISTYEWKATCPSGAEPAPTLITDGFPLTGLITYVVTIEARKANQTLVSIPEGGVMTYIWDTQAEAWSECQRCFFYSVPTLATKRQTFPAIPPPIGISTRIALIPIAVQVSDGGVNIYITGQPRI